MLKNRATNRVLFVVLFTLYLKDDVDEEGNIKPGVLEEANKPFEERSKETIDAHGKAIGATPKNGKKGGWWWGGGDSAVDEDENEEVDEKVVENGKIEQKPTTSDDDVD